MSLTNTITNGTSQIVAEEATEAAGNNPAQQQKSISYGGYVPYGITNFYDYEIFSLQKEQQDGVDGLTLAFKNIINNIFGASEIQDKAAAVLRETNAFQERLAAMLEEEGEAATEVKDRWLDKLRRRKKKKAAPDAAPAVESPDETTEFMLRKTASGDWRWMGIVSNNFMDRDNPPDLISAAAHREFAHKVMAGEAEMPELWHYHQPWARWGVAQLVAYDEETGMLWAEGKVDKDHYADAEALSRRTDLGMSHGMPRDTIKRDPANPHVITEYRSIEFSDLPLSKAANFLTGFGVVEKGVELMPIQENVREYLRTAGWTDADIDAQVEKMKGLAAFGKAIGLEQKDADATPSDAPAETPVSPPASPVETPPAPVEPVAVETPPAEAAPSLLEQLKQTLEELLLPIRQKLELHDAALLQTATSVVGLGEQIKALKDGETGVLKTALEHAPQATLAALLLGNSPIGQPEAAVTKNSRLVKSAPHQDKPEEGPEAGTLLGYLFGVEADA